MSCRPGRWPEPGWSLSPRQRPRFGGARRWLARCDAGVDSFDEFNRTGAVRGRDPDGSVPLERQHSGGRPGGSGERDGEYQGARQRGENGDPGPRGPRGGVQGERAHAGGEIRDPHCSTCCHGVEPSPRARLLSRSLAAHGLQSRRRRRSGAGEVLSSARQAPPRSRRRARRSWRSRRGRPRGQGPQAHRRR